MKISSLLVSVLFVPATMGRRLGEGFEPKSDYGIETRAGTCPTATSDLYTGEKCELNSDCTRPGECCLGFYCICGQTNGSVGSNIGCVDGPIGPTESPPTELPTAGNPMPSVPSVPTVPTPMTNEPTGAPLTGTFEPSDIGGVTELPTAGVVTELPTFEEGGEAATGMPTGETATEFPTAGDSTSPPTGSDAATETPTGGDAATGMPTGETATEFPTAET